MLACCFVSDVCHILLYEYCIRVDPRRMPRLVMQLTQQQQQQIECALFSCPKRFGANPLPDLPDAMPAINSGGRSPVVPSIIMALIATASQQNILNRITLER